MGKGEIFSLASAMAWAVAVILFQRSGESMRPLALNLFKSTLGVLAMIPTVLVAYGPIWPDFSGYHLSLMLASGCIGIAVADMLYFMALNTIGASRTGIVASLYGPSVILLSYLFLSERLGISQVLGLLLVLAGVLLVSYRRGARDVSSQALRRGITLAACAVFLMALGVVMVKRILETQPFLWVVQIRLLGGLAGTILLMLVRRRSRLVWAEYRKPHRWWAVAAGCLLGSYVSMLFWLAGYKYTLASIAAVLNETSSIFIVLLAWFVLGEPLSRRKLIGVSLTFVGVAFMVLS